jgi:hypothetical protein
MDADEEATWIREQEEEEDASKEEDYTGDGG